MAPCRGHRHGVCHALITLRYRRYCFEPVVPFFGFGEQFRFWGLASFSHAARLAYLQLSGPPGDVAMQNAPVPVACMPLPEPVCPMVPCACANEIPATRAATAVSVVRVFIICLLGSACRNQMAALRNNRGAAMLFPEPGLRM